VSLNFDRPRVDAVRVLATTHVLTGALIGRVVHRPAYAAAAGLVSHVAMDALPHWGLWPDTPHRRAKFLTVMVRRHRPGSEIAGALGALVLDLDKPAALIGIRQLWPDQVNAVHFGVQRHEQPQRWRIDVSVAALVALTLWATEVV
jgi:hypothetical protein